MGIDRLPSLLLMVHDGREKAIEMLVLAVIVFVELLEAIGQVCAQHHGWIIPLEGSVVQMQLVLLVVGEAGEFLYLVVSFRIRSSGSGRESSK